METLILKQLRKFKQGRPEIESAAFDALHKLTPKDGLEQELLWTALAFATRNSAPASFLSSRNWLTQRVSTMHRQTASTESALFIMELLLRNPKKTIEDHSLTIDAFLLDLFDDSVRNESQAAEEGKEAAMAAFALRHGLSAIPRILKTLTIVLSKRMTTEADQSEILQLKVLGQPAHRGKLAKTLLELLAKILGKAKPGESVPLNELIATLAQVLREKELQPLAFGVITRLAEASGAALFSLVPKIVSLLTSNLDTPSAALFACIGKYAELYGPSSGLQTRLFDIWASMVQLLHEQEYKNEAAYAVSQIITRCGHLVKPEVQKGIARSPVKNEAGEALVKFLAPNPSQRTIPGLSEAKAPTYTRMGVYRKKSEASPPKTVSSVSTGVTNKGGSQKPIEHPSTVGGGGTSGMKAQFSTARRTGRIRGGKPRGRKKKRIAPRRRHREPSALRPSIRKLERPRKERVMKATWEDMEQFRLKPGQRDYCAHHLIDLMKCQTKNAPFAGHACDDQRGAWDKCEYEDHLMRIKEYERERRLLHRKQRKEHA